VHSANRICLAAEAYAGGHDRGERAWRQRAGAHVRVGVLLTREEKARLTPAQLQQYLDDSVVLDLSEIEHMPEPMRSWARAAIDDARARASAHIAEQERTQAS
jgi:hypothetical protein